MNRRSFLQASAALASPMAPTSGLFAQAVNKLASDKTKAETLSESARRIEKAKAAAMAMQRRDWEQGILAQAMLEAGGREEVILLTKAAIVLRMPDGRLGVQVRPPGWRGP